jgi:hypothetical protein
LQLLRLLHPPAGAEYSPLPLAVSPPHPLAVVPAVVQAVVPAVVLAVVPAAEVPAEVSAVLEVSEPEASVVLAVSAVSAVPEASAAPEGPHRAVGPHPHHRPAQSWPQAHPSASSARQLVDSLQRPLPPPSVP